MAIRHLNKIIVFSSLALLALTQQADAAAMVGGGIGGGGGGGGGSGGGASTVGGVITSVMSSFENFPNILASITYILGLLLSITGVFKFKDHVDSPQQHPLSDGVKRFLAGGMLLSAPYVGSAAYGSLFSSEGSNHISDSGRHGNPTGGGMDQMIVDFVSNIAGPMEKLLTAFTYIAAIALLIVGISRLTKTAQEGPRGPAGIGTLMTFLACGALFSFGDMMGAFSSSLFGSTTVSTYANISTNVISAADANKIAPVIEAVMAFIMIVGYISFIRGWFVLKAFADGGNGNASIAQALTFLFGGALAINLGSVVNVLQKTIGVSGITFG